MQDCESLFPAHAGVIRGLPADFGAASTVPRTRGGDPKTGELAQWDRDCSPHTRG